MAQTTTKTQQRTQTPPPPVSKGQVAVIAPPRLLPPEDKVLADYSVDNHGWRTLVESIFPAAKTATSVIMALDYCKRRKLDVFKHPVHIVPIWNSSVGERGGYVETIWPGINELRTTAIRTGQYAGMDVPSFGPMVERTFKGKVKKFAQGGAQWEDVEATVQFPEWCQITVYRVLGGNRVPFPGPRVYWLETYSRMSNFCEVPNSMWEKRANGQLEKCAEAAALRRAFPEEIGSDYSIDEIGAFTTHAPTDVTDEGSATVAPAEPRRDDPKYQQPSDGGSPHTDQSEVGQAGAQSSTADGGKPVDSGPSAQPEPKETKPKGAVTDVQDQNEDVGVTFEKFTSYAKFYDWSDTFLESTATTEAQARAWRKHYDKEIEARLKHDNPTARAEMNDTLNLYLKKVGVAPDPTKERQPGEEG